MYDYRKNNSELDENFIVSTIFQLLNAVNFLHSKGYVHRNICAENTSVFNDGRLVKITSFSRAQKSTNGKFPAYFSDVVQAPEYLSPRVVSGLPYRGILQDTWAVGVVLIFLVTQRYLWDLALNKTETAFKIFGTKECPFNSVEDKSLKYLLVKLLEVDDARMLSVSEIVDNWMEVKTINK